MIYLDYAANTPVSEEVLQVFCEYHRTYFGNPNSLHAAGRSANEAMNGVTQSIANLLQVKASEVIYTSGASEANNTAIKGITYTNREKGKHIITTVLEHSSVSAALTSLQNKGYEIELCDLTKEGQIDLSMLKEMLRNDTVLVTLPYVDSEMGLIQPIKEVTELIKDFPNCHLHVDATQAIGRIPVSMDGVDTLSFAPHKFFGINGCGVLIKREGLVIEPLIHGGVSTSLYRSGTPCVALAKSIEKALSLALLEEKPSYDHVKEYNDWLREKLSAYPLVTINSTKHSVPHILNVSVRGVKGYMMQEELDAHGICISTKSACSVKNTPSRAVYAVTKDKKNAMYSFRISMSKLTTKDELEQFLDVFEKCYTNLTKKNN